MQCSSGFVITRILVVFFFFFFHIRFCGLSLFFHLFCVCFCFSFSQPLTAYQGCEDFGSWLGEEVKITCSLKDMTRRRVFSSFFHHFHHHFYPSSSFFVPENSRRTFFFPPLRYNPVVLSLANIRRGTSRPIPEVSLPPLHHFHIFFLRVRLVHFFFYPCKQICFCFFFSRSAHLFFLLHPDCAHLGNLC